jgi:hypothetical protein
MDGDSEMSTIPQYVIDALSKVDRNRLEHAALSESAIMDGELLLEIHDVDPRAIDYICTNDGQMIDSDKLAAAVEALRQYEA